MSTAVKYHKKQTQILLRVTRLTFEKISDETIKRVQQELERSGYIPNMAGILLARKELQNSLSQLEKQRPEEEKRTAALCFSAAALLVILLI